MMRDSTESFGIDLDKHNFEASADLRRRAPRELAEHLVRCARFASNADRALIERVYSDGLSATAVAQTLGQRPRAVRRRVRRLVKRFLDPRFNVVLKHRDTWPARRRRVATACVLEGRTLRETAEALNTTLHVVRREMAVVDALVSHDHHASNSQPNKHFVAAATERRQHSTPPPVSAERQRTAAPPIGHTRQLATAS